jgi:isoleucyl-tRNA synthetase
MAPILSFTAEEITQLQGGESVMLTTWHTLPELAEKSASPKGTSFGALAARWQALRAVRAEAMKAIEEVRSSGGVGSSLQADLEIRAAGETYDLLASLGEDLKFVLICSKVTLQKVGAGDTVITVAPSAHAKCARCWHWREDVGRHDHAAGHPELCGRCAINMYGTGEAREFA